MSPAQLHRRSDKDGYSGMAVDVWAAGVLLTVMLLGGFSGFSVLSDGIATSVEGCFMLGIRHARWRDARGHLAYPSASASHSLKDAGNL